MTTTNNPTLDALHAKLATITDPTTYDKVEQQIRAETKASNIRQAQAAADKQVTDASARNAAVAKHNENVHQVGRATVHLADLDLAIFEALTTTFALIEERYTAGHETRNLARRTANEAQNLALPEPPPFIDPNNWVDTSSLNSFAAEWITRFGENSRAANKAGVEMTLAHMPLMPYNITKPVPEVAQVED